MPACDECGQWPQPALAVDAVVITNGEILLITRGREPWKGMLALPGGFVDKGEDPEIAVLRELKEETGLNGEVERLLCV
ncbi:MAG: NUDIX hydrolase, partial [Candidatus Poseidoniaceae archaeon]|nr:NUDIX hydrolase [Candidatus Poseidoniaceae archaeon]